MYLVRKECDSPLQIKVFIRFFSDIDLFTCHLMFQDHSLMNNEKIIETIRKRIYWAAYCKY